MWTSFNGSWAQPSCESESHKPSAMAIFTVTHTRNILLRPLCENPEWSPTQPYVPIPRSKESAIAPALMSPDSLKRGNSRGIHVRPF